MKKLVNQTMIDAVKFLVNTGTKTKQIARAFNCSVATVGNIKRTKYNYESYKYLVNNQVSKLRKDDTTNGQLVESSNLEEVKDVRYQIILNKLDTIISKVNTLLR